MGTPKTVALLLKRMEGVSTAMRNKMVRAVIKIMGGQSLRLLSVQDRDRFRRYLPAALDDEDEAVQDAAMQGFASIGGEDATAAILQRAEGLGLDMDHERWRRIADCLAAIGMNGELEAAVRGEKESSTLVAVEAMARLGGGSGLPSAHGGVLAQGPARCSGRSSRP